MQIVATRRVSRRSGPTRERPRRSIRNAGGTVTHVHTGAVMFRFMVALSEQGTTEFRPYRLSAVNRQSERRTSGDYDLTA